jgi:hypothetical protein
MNPADGRAVEGAREAALVTSEDSGGHWVTINGRHVLIQGTQNPRPGRVNQSHRNGRAKIEYPSNESERRLAVIVYNETGGLTPSSQSGKGSAADLHDACVAAAEIAKRAIEGGQPNSVAPDELKTGLWQGLNDRNPAAVNAWNDSLSAARTATAGSNSTEDATHFRLDSKTGRIPPWAQTTQPTRTFGRFRNAGGGDAAAPRSRFYVYR